MAAKRAAELWEIADGRLQEAQGWMANCLSVVSGWRGGNHPRQDEFLQRWAKLSATLGVLRMDLEALAEDQQRSGFPWGQGKEPGSMTP